MADQGKTKCETALLGGVSQPQLSRILAGAFNPARSAAAQRLCALAGIPMQEVRERGSDGRELHQALDQVWDGTPEDAGRLADLLRALDKLRHFDRRRGLNSTGVPEQTP
jgi:hypothetical protein